MGRRTNKFSKAIKHIKSTEIDDKLAMLEAAPTNNTMGYMSTGVHGEPKPDTVTNAFPTLPLPDFDQDDPSENGRDTSGLFNPSGVHAEGTKILVVEPPGDTSYILGPMSAMYYTWSYPWTMIGYIRESDRKMIDLARIDGKLSDWDGVTGFRNNWWGGQLTLEQAVWFRDVKKYNNSGNDPANANYRAFYPGPPSNSPDAFGRYFCVTTGEAKNNDHAVPNPGKTEPIPGTASADEVFAAIMERLRRGELLSNDEKEFLEKYNENMGGEFDIWEVLKDIGGHVGAVANDPFAYLRRIGIKGFFELGKLMSNFTGKETAYGMANAFGHMNSHYDNNNPLHPDFRKHDPTSDNYVGPKEINFDPKTAAEVTEQLDIAISNLNNGNGPTNPNGNLTPEEIQQIDNHMNDPFRSGSTEGWAVSFYNTLHSLPPDTTTITVRDGKFEALDSNYVFTDPRDANPIAVDEMIYGNASFTNFLANMLTGITDQATGNGRPTGDGGQPFYKHSVDDPQYGRGPNNEIIGTQYNTQSQFKRHVPKKTDLNFTTMSFVPQGNVISESRKTRILKNIKKPVVLPKEPKKFKVKPKLRTSNKWMGSSPKISKPVETPKEYKQIGGRNLWGKAEYNYNTTQSQERMNQVYELVGSGNMAFDHMLTDSKKMNDEQMEKFWGNNQDLYSYFYGGKKYKLVRKEAMDGDYLVFLIDDHGEKVNILQSELNEKVAEEQQKKELEEYNKMNPKEPVSVEKDYMFKKVQKRLKPQIDYKDKPAKMGYPNDPPPEMVNNRHPDFGKRPGTTAFNKLDPQSAAAMPQQDDETIDAKVKDAKENPKKDSAMFRRKLDDKMKKERERLNKEEWEKSDWRKELEGII